MKVIEITQIPDAAIELDIIKEHLRLGTGFTNDGLEDPVLLAYARAAICAIEARVSQTLIARAYEISLTSWPSDELRPAVTPINAITSAQITDATGQLVQDITAQISLSHEGTLLLGSDVPALLEGQIATIRVTVGRANSLAALAPDLRHAALMLTAHYYDHRSETGLDGRCMPFGVTALLEPYRPIRIGMGGRA